MKVKLKIEKEFDVKYLQAEVGARYWEDATVNGEEDTEGTLIPCRDGEYWKPLIDIESGIIVNWDKGTTAFVHYKCCDDGLYKLLDADKREIKSIDGYVPSIMCPKENGYGDYVIMDIDRDGKISNWKPILSDFQDFRRMTDPATINGLVAVAMTALGLLLGLIFWLKKSGKK